jgi:hypothetical protein
MESLTVYGSKMSWNASRATTSSIAAAAPNAIAARHVFCFTIGKKAGQGVTEGGYNKAWRRARVEAGCPGRIPHDFRDSTALPPARHRNRSPLLQPFLAA